MQSPSWKAHTACNPSASINQGVFKCSVQYQARSSNWNCNFGLCWQRLSKHNKENILVTFLEKIYCFFPTLHGGMIAICES